MRRSNKRVKRCFPVTLACTGAHEHPEHAVHPYHLLPGVNCSGERWKAAEKPMPLIQPSLHLEEQPYRWEEKKMDSDMYGAGFRPCLL
jgi:hypothetical protein